MPAERLSPKSRTGAFGAEWIPQGREIQDLPRKAQRGQLLQQVSLGTLIHWAKDQGITIRNPAYNPHREEYGRGQHPPPPHGQAPPAQGGEGGIDFDRQAPAQDVYRICRYAGAAVSIYEAATGYGETAVALIHPLYRTWTYLDPAAARARGRGCAGHQSRPQAGRLQWAVR